MTTDLGAARLGTSSLSVVLAAADWFTTNAIANRDLSLAELAKRLGTNTA